MDMNPDESTDSLIERDVDNVIVRSNGTTVQTTINEENDDREVVPRFGNTASDSNTSSSSSEEQSPSVTPTKVYFKRWYILMVFSLITFSQGIVWNTWGPLASSAQIAFGWDDAQIALMTNWGPICYIFTAIQFSWLLDVKGIKVSCIIAMALVFVGCGLRCITMTPPAVTWLVHIGQILNGIGGPVGVITPPLLSAVWFPVEQRATATAIGVLVNGLGVALAFIAGPMLVPTLTNTTSESNSSHSLESNYYYLNRTTTQTWLSHSTEKENTTQPFLPNVVDVTRHNIHIFMYIEFAWSAALFLIVLLYFPNKPPLPPSQSASKPRVEFKSGFRALFRHRLFWMLAIPYALSSGVYNCWAAELDVILGPLGISEETAGWIGFYGTLAGQVTAFFVGRFADLFARRMKVILIILYTLATVVFSVFALECAHIIPIQIATLFAAMIIGSACLDGVVPLFFELACESTYPVAEGVTNGVMTWLQNFTGLIFLIVVMFPINMSWTIWMLVGSIIVCLPIFFLYKERYGRLDVDCESKTTTSSSRDEQNDEDSKHLVAP